VPQILKGPTRIADN